MKSLGTRGAERLDFRMSRDREADALPSRSNTRTREAYGRRYGRRYGCSDTTKLGFVRGEATKETSQPFFRIFQKCFTNSWRFRCAVSISPSLAIKWSRAFHLAVRYEHRIFVANTSAINNASQTKQRYSRQSIDTHP